MFLQTNAKIYNFCYWFWKNFVEFQRNWSACFLFPIKSSKIVFFLCFCLLFLFCCLLCSFWFCFRKYDTVYVGIKKNFSLECICLLESTIAPCMVIEVSIGAVVIQYLSPHIYPFYFMYFLKSLELNKTWKEMSYLMSSPELQ